WVVDHQATLGWVSGALVVAAIAWVATSRLRSTGSSDEPGGPPDEPNTPPDQGASRSTSQPPATRRY
ncbi:MAG: hypothetical protein KDB24_01920, partial [Microthrixaceae bacterium]|nr:hypothetical protein [Microthrixaceae bacterium]